MKFKNLSVAVLAIFLLLGCENKESSKDSAKIDTNSTESKLAQNAVKVDEKIDLKLLSNEIFSLQKRENGFDIKDNEKATLFVFWATWCPPCKAEIPHLNNLSEKYKKELNIIAVLLEDKNEDEIKAFAQKYQIKYDIAIGESNYLFEKAIGGIFALPSSALFDKNGDYASGYKGLVPEEMLERDIQKAIE
ncbi:TlpA family protein disulfide reductase [Campylobacter sp. RM13119]|uniref:TlpA family protein disulfide reductase n=1 Tax=Campylobacter TaxID=194 RepID=UPI0014739545|nr:MULTISPECIES: TlpA disulfide reductase family protein [unclassified Campylobacter]MBE3606962.1 TlpA family protein disulfide reductase [Campylobacter sp. RM13119]MBE3610053.1 TlpA family protein disulfide reductase [Campylobacter sp. RM12916]